jgi:hypothetical protein
LPSSSTVHSVIGISICAAVSRFPPMSELGQVEKMKLPANTRPDVLIRFCWFPCSRIWPQWAPGCRPNPRCDTAYGSISSADRLLRSSQNFNALASTLPLTSLTKLSQRFVPDNQSLRPCPNYWVSSFSGYSGLS